MRYFVLTLIVAICGWGTARAAVVTYNDFSSTSGLKTGGSAVAVYSALDGHVMQLTNALPNQMGGILSTTSVSASEFSTEFRFRITNHGGIRDRVGQSGADGIMFVMRPTLGDVGAGGGGMGFNGLPGPSVGVEFDSFMNDIDPSANHVGIDFDGRVISAQTANVSPNFDSGQLWCAWIDYRDGVLEVRVDDTEVRPAAAVLSRNIDLAEHLGHDAIYLGFSSGTGDAYATHWLTGWNFRDPVPSPQLYNNPPTGAAVPLPPAIWPGVAMLVAMGAMALRRRWAA